MVLLKQEEEIQAKVLDLNFLFNKGGGLKPGNYFILS